MRKIVRDQQDRHAGLGLQFLQQVQDLGLNGNIERGGRFVSDQQLRLARQLSQSHGALSHAAGKFMRMLVNAQMRIRDVHALQ